MKSDFRTTAHFASALDAFAIGWNGGPVHRTADDVAEAALTQPSFAMAMDAFGIGLPEQKVQQRRTDPFTVEDPSCCLAGYCTC